MGTEVMETVAMAAWADQPLEVHSEDFPASEEPDSEALLSADAALVAAAMAV